MKIDEMLREQEKARMLRGDGDAGAEQEELSDAEGGASKAQEGTAGGAALALSVEVAPARKEDKEPQHKRTKLLAKALQLPFKQAHMVIDMMESKDVHSKTLDGVPEEDPLAFLPAAQSPRGQVDASLSPMKQLALQEESSSPVRACSPTKTTGTYPNAATTPGHESPGNIMETDSLNQEDLDDQEKDKSSPYSSPRLRPQMRKQQPAQALPSVSIVAERYLQDLADDDDLEDVITHHMKGYMDAKYRHGQSLSLTRHLPGFTHVTGSRQMDIKISKRMQAAERHGCANVPSAMKTAKGK